MNPEIWINQALLLARQAVERDEVPVGALLVCNNQVIGRGSNQREEKARAIAHAEVQALDDYSAQSGEWRLPEGTSLFVTVEPCLMCTGALLWARVENIFYGCRDTKHAGIERIASLISEGVYDHRFKEIVGGILSAECSELMSSYFKKKRVTTGV